MNTERIRELAEQAAKYAIEFATQDQELYIPKLMEKFAALVAAEEREACAKMCEAQVAVYLKDGERWLKGKKGQPDTRMKDLAPHMEAAWEAEQLLKNKSGVEWITQAHKFAAAIRARGNE